MQPRLKNQAIEIRYEELVDNLESVSRRVLDFLGVDWDERVLRFHEHARNKTVRSPTATDVTRPIFKTAVGRWRNYQKYLEPHLDKLEPFQRRLATIKFCPEPERCSWRKSRSDAASLGRGGDACVAGLPSENHSVRVKMRRGRRVHQVATRRRRYFGNRPTASFRLSVHHRLSPSPGIIIAPLTADSFVGR